MEFRSKINAAGFTIFSALAVGCAAATGSTEAPSTVASTAPASPPATRPSRPPSSAPSMQKFQDPAGLLNIAYPPDWKLQHDPDYVLELADGSEMFTLDIPDLPPHIPGMIPLGLVVNGYIDDLKKSHPGVKTDEEAAAPIPKARLKRLHSAWSEKSASEAEVATLIVHGDHVFILRIVTPADQLATARTAYGGIVDSLRWLK